MDIPSLFMIPSAVSSGKVHSVFPNSTDADFDFNRDSDATRVNSEGLIERVGYYGSELVTNGSFATDSNWVKQTGWSIANGKASSDGSQSLPEEIYQTGVVVIGKTYKLVYNIVDYTSGTVRIRCGNTFDVTNNAIGTYTAFLTATSNGGVGIQASADFIGSIDNVSVKEVTGDRARLNYEIEGGLVNTKPSLLLEPQSTNLLTYSENFLSSIWTVIPSYTKNAVVTKVNSKNPYGTYESYQYKNVNQGQAQSQLGALVSASAGVTYTSSIYIRRVKGTGTITFMNINNVSNDITSQVTSEWKRFTTTATAAGAVARVYINVGTEGDIIEVFGAQLEQSSYATSYIPTNGSTQTRAAETCNGAGTSSIFNDSEGILYAEYASLGNDGSVRYLGLSDGSSSNRAVILNDGTTNNIRGIVSSGGTKYADFGFVVSDVTTFNKVALKWKANDFQLWINGVKRAEDSAGLAPIGLDRFGFDLAGSGPIDAKIRDIRVYNTKEMTDSEVDILLTKITS
jgi:hypothetical protein